MGCCGSKKKADVSNDEPKEAPVEKPPPKEDEAPKVEEKPPEPAKVEEPRQSQAPTLENQYLFDMPNEPDAEATPAAATIEEIPAEPEGSVDGKALGDDELTPLDGQSMGKGELEPIEPVILPVQTSHTSKQGPGDKMNVVVRAPMLGGKKQYLDVGEGSNAKGGSKMTSSGTYYTDTGDTTYTDATTTKDTKDKSGLQETSGADKKADLTEETSAESSSSTKIAKGGILLGGKKASK